jgi:hypothetical protein
MCNLSDDAIGEVVVPEFGEGKAGIKIAQFRQEILKWSVGYLNQHVWSATIYLP